MHLKLHALHKRQWIANVTTLRAKLREMWWMHRCRVMDDMPWQKQKPVTWHTIFIHTVPRTLPLWPNLFLSRSLLTKCNFAFDRQTNVKIYTCSCSTNAKHHRIFLSIVSFCTKYTHTHRPYHFPMHFTHFPSRLSGHVLFNPPFGTEYFTNISSFHCLCFDGKSLSHLFLLCSVRLSLSFAPFLILKTWKCSYC